MKSLRELFISEPEAPQDAPLGSYAFAPQRKGKVPYEENTVAEEEIYSKLIDYIINNRKMPDNVIAQIKSFQEMGLYSSIFKAPAGKYIYRGLALSKDDLKRYGINPDAGRTEQLRRKRKNTKGLDESPGRPDDSTFDDVLYKDVKMTYTPLYGSTSGWSTDIDAAREFSGGTPKRIYSCLIVADLTDNPNTFISGPGGFYDIDATTSYQHELESIALGPVKVFRLYWQKRNAHANFVMIGHIKEP